MKVNSCVIEIILQNIVDVLVIEHTIVELVLWKLRVRNVYVAFDLKGFHFEGF